MSKRHKIRLESDVGNAPDESFSDPVADGARATVKDFGASIPGTGSVDLHWGQGTTWELIRSVSSTTYEFTKINDDFNGDGVKQFRVTRTKFGGGGPLAIRAWFDAIER